MDGEFGDPVGMKMDSSRIGGGKNRKESVRFAVYIIALIAHILTKSWKRVQKGNNTRTRAECEMP